MKHLLIILSLISQSLFCIESKTLHALILSDPDACDFSTAYTNDAQRMRDCMQNVAFQADMDAKITVLQKEKVTSKHIIQWISALPQWSGDTVVVYYSGRGAHPYSFSKKAIWPAIMTHNHARHPLPILSEDEMYSMLAEKNPRLILIFFDCYTQLLPSERITCATSEKGQKNAAIKTLFADSVGYVVHTSAKNGKPGFAMHFASNTTGGFFTDKLISILNSAADTPLIDWSSVFAKIYLSFNAFAQYTPEMRTYDKVRIPGRDRRAHHCARPCASA